MRGISMRENREVPWLPVGDGTAGRIGKAGGREPMMNGQGTSDRPVVPTKPPNRAGAPVTEVVEGRGWAKGNTGQQNAPRTQSRVGAPSALDRVREVARRDRKTKFTALFHHLTIDRLREALFRIKKEAVPGVDGVRWEQYQAERPSGGGHPFLGPSCFSVWGLWRSVFGRDSSALRSREVLSVFYSRSSRARADALAGAGGDSRGGGAIYAAALRQQPSQHSRSPTHRTCERPRRSRP